MLHSNYVGEIGKPARRYDLDQRRLWNTAGAMLPRFAEQQELDCRPDYFRRLASCDAP